MPTPPLSRAEIDRRIQAYHDAVAGGAAPVGVMPRNGQVGAVAVAAKRCGINAAGIYSALKDAGPQPVAKKELAEVSLPVFPDEDVDAKTILDHMAKRFARRKAAADARKWFRIKVNVDAPIGVTWFGDPHIGSNGCNVPLLRQDVSVVAATPGMYGANIGDTVDGWGGRLIKLYAENDVSKKTERVLARWFLRDSGVKWLLWLHGNHDCHDQDTELLTREGWKKWGQIDAASDEVLGFDPNSGGMVWQPINQVIAQDYCGPMVRVLSKHVSKMVTPNHRVLLKSRVWADNKNDKKGWTPWRYDVAGALPPQFMVPCAAPLAVAAGSDKTDDEIRFAAWVLTDGCITRVGNSRSITIYQSKDATEILRILHSLGLSYSHAVRNREIKEICGRALVKDALPEQCFRVIGASSRYALSIISQKDRLPDWVWHMTTKQFDVFLTALIAGDGSWATNGKERAAVLYGRRSFLDQVQALAVQNGWRAYITVFRGNDHRLNLCRAETSIVARKSSVSQVMYAGKTWCLRVPLGNFVIRRDGRACVSGNSMGGDFTHYMEACNASFVPMIDWRAQFILVFPNGSEFRIDAAHNHKGHSMWNELHGQERASYMEEPSELIVAGHHHTWAHKAKEMSDGRVVHLVRARGYKFLDSHAARWQFAEQQSGASIVTIFNPHTDRPTERVKVFADVEAGADFLTWLRAKTGAGPVAGGGNGKAKRSKA